MGWSVSAWPAAFRRVFWVRQPLVKPETCHARKRPASALRTGGSAAAGEDLGVNQVGMIAGLAASPGGVRSICAAANAVCHPCRRML